MPCVSGCPAAMTLIIYNANPSAKSTGKLPYSLDVVLTLSKSIDVIIHNLDRYSVYLAII